MTGNYSYKKLFFILRKSLLDEKGSIYLEYSLVACAFLLMGLSLLTPGGVVWQVLGFDMNFRYLLMRLPIF